MSHPFSPDDYGPTLAPLLRGDRRRALDSGTSEPELSGALRGLTVADGFAHTAVADKDAARACLSGLWLLADDLDASHAISQSLDTPEGSFWHGVMHRREGDFGNAKYWFRCVGDHPVYALLAEHFGDWDPYAMVDACERAVRTDAGLDACLDRQQAEWETLFEWCYRCARGQ